jgi:hypothetical protein
MKIIIICSILTVFSSSLCAQTEFFKFIKKAPNFQNLNGCIFIANNDAPYEFFLNGKPLEINYNDTISYNVYNEFIYKSLYPSHPKKHYPKIIFNNSEKDLDSIDVTSVGIVSPSKLLDGKICNPKIVVLAKRELNKNHLDFILYTDVDEGVFIEIYSYSKSQKKVVSYLELFSGLKSKRSCDPLGINYVSTYQTITVKDDIITQTVNDGYQELWDRKIRLNKDGYYEVIWHSNPTRKSKIFEAVINDSDGYTNVRQEPNTNSPVIFKIYENEKFSIEEFPNTQNWYRIYNYKDKYEGWIHKSRVSKKKLVIDSTK